MQLPAPLFIDPVYGGSTDPVVIWNPSERLWWMFYTQRRSTDIRVGFSTIHGTKIGVASSYDGTEWLYRGTLPALDFEEGHNTFWAPEVICSGGRWHMYVSYIQGIPTNWNRPRLIVHYTSDGNLWRWKFESVLDLPTDRAIDACVYEVSPGFYKMWYKNERDDCSIWTAVSTDLYNWRDAGQEISDCPHEGPNVFELGGLYWMITDIWDGLGVYSSDDCRAWRRQPGQFLKAPGRRSGDSGKAHHADVLCVGGRAYIFYFVHPDPSLEAEGFPAADACVQAAELLVENGTLVCDRDVSPAALPQGG